MADEAGSKNTYLDVGLGQAGDVDDEGVFLVALEYVDGCASEAYPLLPVATAAVAAVCVVRPHGRGGEAELLQRLREVEQVAYRRVEECRVGRQAHPSSSAFVRACVPTSASCSMLVLGGQGRSADP